MVTYVSENKYFKLSLKVGEKNCILSISQIIGGDCVSHLYTIKRDNKEKIRELLSKLDNKRCRDIFLGLFDNLKEKEYKTLEQLLDEMEKLKKKLYYNIVGIK